VKNKKRFVFILSLIYRSDLFKDNLSANRLAWAVLLFCRVPRKNPSKGELTVKTLARYITEERLDDDMHIRYIENLPGKKQKNVSKYTES